MNATKYTTRAPSIGRPLCITAGVRTDRPGIGNIVSPAQVEEFRSTFRGDSLAHHDASSNVIGLATDLRIGRG